MYDDDAIRTLLSFPELPRCIVRVYAAEVQFLPPRRLSLLASTMPPRWRACLFIARVAFLPIPVNRTPMGLDSVKTDAILSGGEDILCLIYVGRCVLIRDSPPPPTSNLNKETYDVRKVRVLGTHVREEEGADEREGGGQEQA